jgi:hypothetical protein
MPKTVVEVPTSVDRVSIIEESTNSDKFLQKRNNQHFLLPNPILAISKFNPGQFPEFIYCLRQPSYNCLRIVIKMVDL